MKNVNILGTEYTIVQDNSIVRDGYDGLSEAYGKQILIRDKKKMLDDGDNKRQKKERYDEVLRHEIIHAFLFESGLDSYNHDEQLVNWIAIQFPKMLKAFKDVECI